MELKMTHHNFGPISKYGFQDMDKLYVNTIIANIKYIVPNIHKIGFITQYVKQIVNINKIFGTHILYKNRSGSGLPNRLLIK